MPWKDSYNIALHVWHILYYWTYIILYMHSHFYIYNQLQFFNMCLMILKWCAMLCVLCIRYSHSMCVIVNIDILLSYIDWFRSAWCVPYGLWLIWKMESFHSCTSFLVSRLCFFCEGQLCDNNYTLSFACSTDFVSYLVAHCDCIAEQSTEYLNCLQCNSIAYTSCRT